jgi:2-polyprenyl-6-methoxyphenol hydroxylase-like FAD-dependent oxidoreductase
MDSLPKSNVNSENQSRIDLLQLEILIIGGGISGFATGIHLINKGFTKITICERDPTFDTRRQGYGLTLLQGLSAIKQLGSDVYEEILHLDTPSRSHFIFNAQGDIVGFYGTIFWPEQDSSTHSTNKAKKKKHNLHISRQNLRLILKQKFERLLSEKSIVNSQILWNKKLDSIEKIDFKYRCNFSDSSTINANIIIGCDGINSKTRKEKYRLNDCPLPANNYLGIIVVLGITHSSHCLVEKKIFQTVDGDMRLFVMPFYDSEATHHNVMWQLSFPLNETESVNFAENVDLLKEYVIAKCSKWHSPIPEMIASTQLEYIMGIPAYDRNLIEAGDLNQDRIALIGDAAHPMSPFKGQGANQALLDSVQLVEVLVYNEKQIKKPDIYMKKSKTNKEKQKLIDLVETPGHTLSSIELSIRKFHENMNKRVENKVLESRQRVSKYHEPQIVEIESYSDRGVLKELIQRLKLAGINSSSGSQLENLIIEEIKKLT